MTDPITERTANLEQGLNDLQQKVNDRATAPAAPLPSQQPAPAPAPQQQQHEDPNEAQDESGAPAPWTAIEHHPAFEHLSPEQKLVTFDNWHQAAYNHLSMQDNWKGKEDPFNQDAYATQKRFSKDLGDLTPDQARVQIASNVMQQKMQQTGKTELSDKEQQQVLDGLSPDIAAAWHKSPKQSMVASVLNTIEQGIRRSAAGVTQGGEYLGALAANNPWLGEGNLSSNDIMESLKNDPTFKWARGLNDPEENQHLFFVDPRNKGFLTNRAGEATSFLPALTGVGAPLLFGAQALGEHVTGKYDDLIHKGVEPEDAATQALSEGLKAGGANALTFAILPKPLRSVADKLLIDTVGKAGMARFLAGRAAAGAEGLALGAASRIGENLASNESLTKDIGEGARGMAIWNLLLPHGDSAKETDFRKNVLSIYQQYGADTANKVMDAFKERAKAPADSPIADQTRDQKVAEATQTFQKNLAKVAAQPAVAPQVAQKLNLEQPKPEPQPAAPQPAEAAPQPAPAEAATPTEVTAPAVETPQIAPETPQIAPEPEKVTATAVEKPAQIGASFHNVNGEEQIRLDVHKDASIEELKAFKSEVAKQGLPEADLKHLNDQIDSEIKARGEPEAPAAEQAATVKATSAAGLEKAEPNPATGMVTAHDPENDTTVHVPNGATKEDVQTLKDAKAEEKAATSNGDEPAKEDAQRKAQAATAEILSRNGEKEPVKEEAPTTRSPHEFRPAIRPEGQEPIVGEKGSHHDDFKIKAATAAEDDVEKSMSILNSEHGFTDQSGKFYSREEASKELGEDRPLTSQQLDRLQKAAPETPQPPAAAAAEAPKPAEGRPSNITDKGGAAADKLVESGAISEEDLQKKLQGREPIQGSKFSANDIKKIEKELREEAKAAGKQAKVAEEVAQNPEDPTPEPEPSPAQDTIVKKLTGQVVDRAVKRGVAPRESDLMDTGMTRGQAKSLLYKIAQALKKAYPPEEVPEGAKVQGSTQDKVRKEKRAAVEEELEATDAAYMRAMKEFKQNPDNEAAAEKAAGLQTERTELRERLKALGERVAAGDTITLKDGTSRTYFTNDPHKTAAQLDSNVRIPKDLIDNDKVNPAIEYTTDPQTGEGVVTSVLTRYSDEGGNIKVTSAQEFHELVEAAKDESRGVFLQYGDPHVIEQISAAREEGGYSEDDIDHSENFNPDDPYSHESKAGVTSDPTRLLDNFKQAKAIGIENGSTAQDAVNKIISDPKLMNQLSPFDQLLMQTMKAMGFDLSKVQVKLQEKPDEGWGGRHGQIPGARNTGIILLNMGVDHTSGVLSTFAHEVAHHVTVEKLTNPRPGAEADAAKDLHTYWNYVRGEMAKKVFGKVLTQRELDAWSQSFKRGAKLPEDLKWVKEGVSRSAYLVSDPAELVTLGNNGGVQLMLSHIPSEPTIKFRGVQGAVRNLLEQGFKILRNVLMPHNDFPPGPDNALVQGWAHLDRLIRVPDETSVAGRAELKRMGFGIGANSGQLVRVRNDMAEGGEPTTHDDVADPNPQKPEDQQVRITSRFAGGQMSHEMKIGDNAGAAEILRSLDSLNANQRIPDAEKNSMRDQLTQALRDRVEKAPISGPRNALIDQARRERGMEPRMEPLRRAQPKVWDEAMQKLDQDSEAGGRLVQEINKMTGKTHIADTDVALLAHEQVVRENKFDQAVDDINNAKNPAEMSEARARRDQARRDLGDVYDAISRTGTMTAQSLAMRKILLNTDLTLGRMEAMMRAARNGGDVSPEEQKSLEESYNRMKKMRENQDIVMDYLKTTGAVSDLDRAAKGDDKALARSEADAKTALREKKAQDRYRKTLLTKLAVLDERMKSGDFTKATKEKKDLPKELQDLQVLYKRELQAFQDRVKREEQRNRPYVKWVEESTGKVARWITQDEDVRGVRVSADRAMEQIADWVRAGVISSPVAMGKLISAAAIRMVLTPTEQGIGAALSKIPGLSEIAAKAPRHGDANLATEGEALVAAMRKIGADMEQIAKTGKSELDVLYGRDQIRPRGMLLEGVGRLHYLAKALPFRTEWERSTRILTDFYEKQAPGVTSNPLVKHQIALDAYKQAESAIFKQNNRVVTAYKAWLGSMGKPDPATGEVPKLAKAFQTLMQTEVPVVGVPTNIAAEAAHYIFGSVTGSWKMANAFKNGVSTLRPEEADAIMNHLKKGSIGAAAMLLAFFAPNVVSGGGFYQKGEKRKSGDIKPEDVKIGGVTIDHRWVHAPLVLAMQFASTIRRQYDRDITPKAKDRNAAAALGASLFGLAESIPMTKAVEDAGKLFDKNERPHFFAEAAKSDAIPQVVQWLAKIQDTDEQGKQIERKPDYKQGATEAMKQTLETGIPYLRENVRQKPKH